MGGGYYSAYDTAAVHDALVDAIYPDETHGILVCGTPACIYWDHGSQHWSEWARMAAHKVGIKLLGEKSEAATPTNHGFVENTHGFVKEHFEALQPGFVGGDNRPDNRPLLARMEDDGEVPAPQYLTLGQLNRAYKAWVAEMHEWPYRDGERSRFDLWLADTPPERRHVPPRQELAWEFMPVETRVVDAAGVIAFRGREYTGPLLNELKGMRVRVKFIEGSASALFVADEKDRLLTICDPLPDVFYDDDVSHRHVAAKRREGRRSADTVEAVKGTLQRLAGEGHLDAGQAAAAGDVLDTAAAALKPGRRQLVDPDLGTPAPSFVPPDVIDARGRFAAATTRSLRDTDAEEALTADVLAGAAASVEVADSGRGLFDY
jgi:hypothetical protein